MKRRLAYDPNSDYYALLGVHPTATVDEIQRAYRRRAKEVHPDINPDQREWATHAFKQLTEAYDVLSDPALRAQYNELKWLHQTYAAAAPPLSNERAGPAKSRPQPAAYDEMKWPRKTAPRRRRAPAASPWIALMFLLSIVFCVGGLLAVEGPIGGALRGDERAHADAPTVVVLSSAPGCASAAWTITRLVVEVDPTLTPIAVRVFGAADVSAFRVALSRDDGAMIRESPLVRGPLSGGLLARLTIPSARDVTYHVSLKAVGEERPDCQVPLVIH